MGQADKLLFVICGPLYERNRLVGTPATAMFLSFASGHQTF